MPPFHSLYQGPNSLSFRDGLGRQAPIRMEGMWVHNWPRGFRHMQMASFLRETGSATALDSAGYVNGDVIRAGSSNLPKVPYMARPYLRYYHPLSGETEKVERAIDQLPGEQPVSRWEIKVGKLAATDDFDQNRYANNNRTQFFNYDFLYNTAWDYAADTRGYTYGVLAALYQPRWRVALASIWNPIPKTGPFSTIIDFDELGYNLELTGSQTTRYGGPFALLLQ